MKLNKMTSVWYMWIFWTTLRRKAFVLFFLPAKGTVMQWPYNCWAWMTGLGPLIGILSWWGGPTCPFCICATWGSGSCRYADGPACIWISWLSGKGAGFPAALVVMHFYTLFFVLILPWNQAFCGVVCSFSSSRVDLPTSGAPVSFTL